MKTSWNVIIADKSYRLTSLDGLVSKGGDWDRQAATATNGKDKDRYPWKWNDQVPSSTSPWNHCQQTTGPENFAISHQVPSRGHSWMWTNPLSPECLVYNEPHTWGICTRRAGKLYKARSRLYRSQILQVNTRWKALAEIYAMHFFAPFSKLKFCLKISEKIANVLPHFSKLNFAKFG